MEEADRLHAEKIMHTIPLWFACTGSYPAVRVAEKRDSSRGALHTRCHDSAWRRVSEMLEVMEKADRLYVEEPMRRSMGEATTSDDSSIRFNEVLHFTFHTVHICKVVSFIPSNGPHIHTAGSHVQVIGQGFYLGHVQHPLQRDVALDRPGGDAYSNGTSDPH